MLVYDATGRSYKVPIAVINDPINFGTDFHMEKLKCKEKPEKLRDLTLLLRCV